MTDLRQEGFVGIVGGPTASGKSALGVELALRHNLAIVSADSMQVYRGMTIGTGAISEAEKCGVPHHVLGVADPHFNFDAAKFVAAAREAARHELERHGRRTLVVGGTGLWIEALREGLFPGPGRDEALRERLRAELATSGAEELHRRLAAVDPESAARLSVRDHVRLVRALEVYELTGRPLSDWFREDRERRRGLGPLLPLYVMAWPREYLRDRIALRIEAMLAAGWQQEALAVAELHLAPHLPAGKALGYRELAAAGPGPVPPDIRNAVLLSTFQYAKRQLTWFKMRQDVVMDVQPTVERAEAALGLVQGGIRN